MTIRVLERDSEVYGVTVAVVDPPVPLPTATALDAWLSEEVRTARTRLVAHLTLRLPLAATEPIAVAQGHGFRFIESLVDYSGPPIERPSPIGIVVATTERLPEQALQQLGSLFLYSRYYRDPWLSAHADEIFSRWATDLERDPECTLLAATCEGVGVGVAGLRREAHARRLRIELIARWGAARGLGVGDALMSAAARIARQEGWELVMGTHPDNYAAQAMLIRSGLAPHSVVVTLRWLPS